MGCVARCIYLYYQVFNFLLRILCISYLKFSLNVFTAIVYAEDLAGARSSRGELVKRRKTSGRSLSCRRRQWVVGSCPVQILLAPSVMIQHPCLMMIYLVSAYMHQCSRCHIILYDIAIIFIEKQNTK